MFPEQIPAKLKLKTMSQLQDWNHSQTMSVVCPVQSEVHQIFSSVHFLIICRIFLHLFNLTEQKTRTMCNIHEVVMRQKLHYKTSRS